MSDLDLLQRGEAAERVRIADFLRGEGDPRLATYADMIERGEHITH